jgi:hypothetical protein
MSGLLDEALFKGDGDKAQLDTGLANRLAAAALQLGAYSVPTGTHTANGMKWQALWARAGFQPGEILAVLTWLEEAYSAELAIGSHFSSSCLCTKYTPMLFYFFGARHLRLRILPPAGYSPYFSNGGLVRAALTGAACWCSVWESRVSA